MAENARSNIVIPSFNEETKSDAEHAVPDAAATDGETSEVAREEPVKKLKEKRKRVADEAQLSEPVEALAGETNEMIAKMGELDKQTLAELTVKIRTELAKTYDLAIANDTKYNLHIDGMKECKKTSSRHSADIAILKQLNCTISAGLEGVEGIQTRTTAAAAKLANERARFASATT